jgi:AmiR/NasT family two-component response regulator
MGLSNLNIRILVAEDDHLVCQMIRGIVEEIGCTVVAEATDGAEALHLTQSLRPDLVLMDLKMPDMDGLTATRLIYEQCPTPVVVLTAYDTPELIEQASSAGVGAYLIKPPNRPELERVITIALARFNDVLALRRLNAQLLAHQEEQARLILELQAALSKVKLLSGLLPICASCKKIRDDRGYWQQIESYIRAHSQAEFTHGLCPDCARKLYPDFFSEDDEF